MQIAYDDDENDDADDADDDDDYDEERMSVPAFSSSARGVPADWRRSKEFTVNQRNARFLEAIFYLLFFIIIFFTIVVTINK